MLRKSGAEATVAGKVSDQHICYKMQASTYAAGLLCQARKLCNTRAVNTIDQYAECKGVPKRGLSHKVLTVMTAGKTPAKLSALASILLNKAEIDAD